MSDIVRRDDQKPVPVKARRVSTPAGDPPSATVRVPPAATEAAPQTVVYVTLPAGQPQPPAAEVHYHTTVTNHHYAPTRRRRQRTTGFLATFAFVVGLAACAAAFVPQLLAVARYGSIGAAALAAVALLGAVAVGRTGTGMPLVAVIVAGLGYGLWLKNAGQLPAAWKQVQAASPVSVPALPPSVTAPMEPPETPAASPPSARSQSPAGRPSEPAARKRPNLFDMSGVGPASTDAGPTPAVPTTPPAAVPPAEVDRAALAATLEQARTAAAARLKVDYASAATAATSAAAAYETADATYPLGAPELAAASQQRIDAYGRLNAVLAQLRADPAVAAAERAVRSAGR